ncbi:putative metallopeptidase, partial [Pseudomonas viridiflava]|uniref:putative metallopeptidase n=1 Tax=Pseudomonas viridiflava TaxID=33069 RepID=UPI0023FA0676
LIELSGGSDFGIRLIPAFEVWEWVHAETLSSTGSIHNEDHAHLLDADIRVMWASSSFEKQGRTVLGQAEQVAFRAGGWQKARMEQQMLDWFG